MAYQKELRLTECKLQGQRNEIKAMEILTSAYGGKYEKSSTRDDKNKHIDMWWTTNKGNVFGIDVKSIDKNGNYWAEAQNVAGGKGAIYGESNYHCYISSEKLLMVETKELARLYEEKVKFKDFVTNKPSKPYIPYKRSNWECKYFNDGRKNDDIIFKLDEKDLLETNNSILIKLG